MSGDKVHLDFVALHFSTRCAAKCSFCYSADPLFEKATPTPLPEVKRILTKLATDGVTEVLFGCTISFLRHYYAGRIPLDD